MPSLIRRLFSWGVGQASREDGRKLGPIEIAAVGHTSDDIAAILNPSSSRPPASLQANAEPGSHTLVYTDGHLGIRFKVLDTASCQLDNNSLQGSNLTAVLFIANLAFYDQPVPQAANHIQWLLSCFATLRSKTLHLPMICILRGTGEFKSRQRDSSLHRCLLDDDADADCTLETGEFAGMKLLMRKINEAGGWDRQDERLEHRGELYLHFAQEQEGGEMEMRFLVAAVKDIVVQAASCAEPARSS